MTQPNQQKPVKPFYRESGPLDIHSIFPTMQGEGPYAGRRAVFVRLWGCNLQCPGCDTEYTAVRRDLWPFEIIMEIIQCMEDSGWGQDLGKQNELVVITGGEPFRQNIAPFVNQLARYGFDVQIETNGVFCYYSSNDIYQQLPTVIPNHNERVSRITVVVSPKTSRITPALEMRADAFKYVIKDGEVVEDDGLPFHALEHKATTPVARPGPGFRGTIYIQPMDEQDEDLNKKNLQATMNSVLNYGHTLCIQLHKLVGVE